MRASTADPARGGLTHATNRRSAFRIQYDLEVVLAIATAGAGPCASQSSSCSVNNTFLRTEISNASAEFFMVLRGY